MNNEIAKTAVIDGENNNGEMTHAQEQATSSAEQTVAATTYQPRFDIWEGESEVVAYGELPGVTAEDLEIAYEDRTLTVKGSVRRGFTSRSYLLREYGVGHFERKFVIGENIDADSIHAELHDGVLELHLPKVASAMPRRIEVKAR